jgi:beta-phosphoglucomutase-like phosphatase (HAD superfamily)
MARAVIFDCDGVLVDSEVIAVEVETALLAEIGLHYEIPEFTARLMGMSDKAFYAALDEDCRMRTDRALPQDFRARVDAGKHALNEQKLAAIAGIEMAVARLGLPRAVASSSDTEHLAYKLRRPGSGTISRRTYIPPITSPTPSPRPICFCMLRMRLVLRRWIASSSRTA